MVKHSWSFEIQIFQIYIHWIFKVLEFHIFEIVNFFNVFNRLLSFHIFYHQLNSIIWVLWKSFVKMFFFNDRNFHFQKCLIKPKLNIGSNGFLIWIFWQSCVLKNNIVPWFPWFQMEKIIIIIKSLVFNDKILHLIPFCGSLYLVLAQFSNMTFLVFFYIQ